MKMRQLEKELNSLGLFLKLNKLSGKNHFARNLFDIILKRTAKQAVRFVSFIGYRNTFRNIYLLAK